MQIVTWWKVMTFFTIEETSPNIYSDPFIEIYVNLKVIIRLQVYRRVELNTKWIYLCSTCLA